MMPTGKGPVKVTRELLLGRTPIFLIAMVPVFALFRLAAYRVVVRSA
jgi:hypothetical protein